MFLITNKSWLKITTEEDWIACQSEDFCVQGLKYEYWNNDSRFMTRFMYDCSMWPTVSNSRSVWPTCTEYCVKCVIPIYTHFVETFQPMDADL